MGSAAVFIVSAPGLVEWVMSRWLGEAASELIIVASDQLQIFLKVSSMGCIYFWRGDDRTSNEYIGIRKKGPSLLLR